MIKVRKALLTDIEKITEIQVITYHNIYFHILDRSQLLKFNKVQQYDINHYIFTSTQHEIFVCEVSNIIVGFIIIGKERNQNINIDFEIYALYVLPEYQCQGIGTLLFQQAKDYVIQQSGRAIIVWVLKDNPSLPFYHQHQFHIEYKNNIQLGQYDYIELGYVYRQ